MEFTCHYYQTLCVHIYQCLCVCVSVGVLRVERREVGFSQQTPVDTCIQMCMFACLCVCVCVCVCVERRESSVTRKPCIKLYVTMGFGEDGEVGEKGGLKVDSA